MTGTLELEFIGCETLEPEFIYCMTLWGRRKPRKRGRDKVAHGVTRKLFTETSVPGSYVMKLLPHILQV